MSDPANRLSSYRSYSYYHVMVLCDSSFTANELSTSTELDVWQHAGDNELPLGRYSPKTTPSGGKYCVLINGSTDSTFVITTARWQSATAAGATQSDRNTSVAIEGSLQISEPKGVVFLDQMVKCCAELGVDAATAVFALKTFFVGFGYEPSVGDFVDYINDLPPLQFIAYDVTGSFTEMGGTYDLQFVSCVNGASRLPQYSKASTGFSFTAGATLQDTLSELERVIRSNYDTYYNCVYQQVKQSAIAAGHDPDPIVRNLRRVNYKIEVGGAYSSNASAYTVTDQPEQAKDLAGCDKPAKIMFPPGTSVEDAIHRIMMMSPRVKKDMSEGDSSDHRKYEYKIHTAVQSTPTGGDAGEMVYTVYYRVERFLRPKDVSLSFDSFSGKNPETDPSIARNVIHFDYIYTGANVDILEFDMKVNMGLAYLQIATLSNTYKSQLEPAQMRATVPSAPGQTQMSRGGKVAQIPVFFGSQIKTPSARNTQNPADTIQAAYTLTQHASIEAAEATMRIIGNTSLLGTVNATTSPERLMDRSTGISQDVTPNKEADFSDWGFIPAFVKVKVKMPRNNDDISLLTGADSASSQTSSGSSRDYAQDFWFDGYYYVYGIDHVFDAGEFTQTLQMIGIPQEGIIKQQGSEHKELDFTQQVDNCFDNRIGCGPRQQTGTGSTVTKAPVIPEPVNGQAQVAPTNKADADTVNQKATTPSDVSGWESKASPEVRDAILKASAVKGVDATLLAQIAQIESSLGKNTSPPSGKARGLFQIVPDTWKAFVRRGKIPDVSPASGDDSLPLRDIPLYNAYGGAQYVLDNQRAIASKMGWSGPEAVSPGDTYLGHFLGTGGAIAVIRGDVNSGGHMTVRQAYVNYFGSERGNAWFNAAKNNNPTLIKEATTTGELRSLTAMKMANALNIKPSTRKTPSVSTATGSVKANPSTGAQALAACRDCDAPADKPTAKQSPCNQGPSTTTTDQIQDNQSTVRYHQDTVDVMGNQTGL